MQQTSLYLIDGNSLVYRAFYAVPPFTTSKGLPTNAVYGFTKMLLKIIRDKKPHYMAVVFDAKGPTFRTEVFEQYKAHRPKTPDQLVIQKPYIRKMVHALNIPVFEIQGIEADDVIGTLARRYERQQMHIVIVTGDKDLMQLVEDGRISIYDTMKDKLYGKEDVYEKLGVYPEHVIDLLSLMGDSSDNIPGVNGIGPKTALKLLEEYTTLDGIYEHLDSVKGAVHDKLERDREQAHMSYQLATIKTDVSLEVTLDDLKEHGPHMDELMHLCDELEFTSLKKELVSFGSFDTSLYEPPKSVHEKRYHTVEDQKTFDDIVRDIKKVKRFAFDTETTSLNPLEAELVGISLSYEEHKGFYVPLMHNNYDMNLDKVYVLQQLFILLDDDSIHKRAHNLKYDLAVLEAERERSGNKIQRRKGKQKDSQMDLFSV